jgi:hypothetical protein
MQPEAAAFPWSVISRAFKILLGFIPVVGRMHTVIKEVMTIILYMIL